MQQFQSLQRLLFFYTLTLIIMLSLYYVVMFLDLKTHSKQHTLSIFNSLQYELIEQAEPTDADIEKILQKPIFQDISYQLVFMLPSGQTYVHRYTRPHEAEFTTVNFPTLASPFVNSNSAYTLNNSALAGTIKLESGHQVYTVLRHQPPEINWIFYRFWLPLMTAIILFIIALLYMLNRRTNWEQLLLYTDNLNSAAKKAYTPPPFIEKKTTADFLRLGHALSRISYQLHNNNRRSKTLNHRLERLVDQAPLPMLMVMRHGQVSFFNQRFEQVFATSFQPNANYQLTDFVTGNDESTQLLLQELSTQRVTRTLLVYGIANKQAYQLHITPWFGEHGQVHGFTVLLNNVNDFVNQTEILQQQNQQLQRQLSEFSQLRSVIGHELRPPLDAIIGILEQIDTKTLTAERHEVLTTLTQSSHSMLAMLNDMLDIANIEAGKTHIINEPVDIFKLGQHVSHLMTDNTRRQGLELLYFFAPDCPRYIDTDSTRLRQILLNLLDSAIQFTTSGYVALVIEPVTIKNRTQTQEQKEEGGSTFGAHDIKAHNVKKDNPQHWVRFSIQDTGIGIVPARQQQLLDYFNKTNNQTSQQFADIGLALATSNSFAQLLGGFIELDSTFDNNRSNEVSTFMLYLPCRRPSYQPVYHFNTNLTHIHLIAVVDQTLFATNLRRLCHYLSIPATIYTAVDIASSQQLTNQLAQNIQTLAPILLLDYEYYEISTIALSEDSEDSNSRITPKEMSHNEANHTEANHTEVNHKKTNYKSTSDKAATNTNVREVLDSLLNRSSLPKILLSMKPERSIPSTLLAQFDGFLSKPLDSALLLSELLRLTQPITQKKNNKGAESATALNNPIEEVLAPLILVVEDSPTNQKITCKLLSKLGYRSMVAEDGQQALDQLQVQRQEIALILMDCRMPVMDGLQATQAIRAQGDDIPIVALTANNTEQDREDCFAVGMDEFLSKPIDKNKLQAVLQHLIKA
ncbi:response regulator [Psychrobacter sp. LV10R520-6]|uniref:response regulator n=1 Tax=Psychrobacter sp. LV10R520-6 TaxID=1415574 RepID=UPI0024CB070D|nr:response regulator [Psychrobacter sp. LV10R520-6]SNT71098.1 CheY chemotaxis protein or a CheY-like REC (receiver) domain [Psychrobacter sp. LV10R520-6]